ncbi:sugar phosphate isomerase/epimerase family protein [Metabacillus sp. Hm71]|uniref:sugar phosphate isomerase/epimerase family protein n=1 Tax=Metabacillus sp. Hm71 TaxID=3450743 RepID=UPI003F41B7EA
MKISLSMWSVHLYWFDGKWTITDFIDFAGTTKAEGVELLSIFWQDQKKELPLVEEALNRNQLTVSSYAACNNFVTADPKTFKEQIKEVTDAIDMATHFGTNIVRVFAGDLPSDGSITYEKGIKFVLKGLSECCKYAEEKGVYLCIENHGLFAGRSDQVIDIINKIGSPMLKSTFDTGNFLLVDQNPSEALLELKEYIQHVHVKDFMHSEVRQDSNTYQALSGKLFLGKIPGDGEVELATIIDGLIRNHYSGWFVVEFEGAEEPSEGSVLSMDYVHQLVSRACSR